MAEAISLLEEEDIDENLLLLTFYKENHKFLKSVFLHQVPFELKNKIAVEYVTTSSYPNEWKAFLEALGMSQFDIRSLEIQSKCPLELALNKNLECTKTFGDVVEGLCQNEKFQILRIIRPFVEGLSKNRSELAEMKTYSSPSPTAPNYEEISKFSVYHETSRTYERNLSTSYDYRNDTINDYEIQKSQILDYNRMVDTTQNSEFHSFFEKPMSRKLSSTVSNIRKANNALTSGSVSIFIMHAMLDKKYAKRLASVLKEKKFQVITSSDIQNMLRENHTKIIKAIHERVDFVIPVVSEFLLKQIEFTGYNTREYRDLESAANCFMYDLLMNEYSSWGCENHRVKPVCVSSESRERAWNDPILSWSYHLKDEVPKLFQELIKSKKRLEL